MNKIYSNIIFLICRVLFLKSILDTYVWDKFTNTTKRKQHVLETHFIMENTFDRSVPTSVITLAMITPMTDSLLIFLTEPTSWTEIFRGVTLAFIWLGKSLGWSAIQCFLVIVYL